jgi:uncharacterized membrane protein YecN with MAPEG domain
MKKLKGNIGRLDKYIRVGIAIVLLMLYNQSRIEIFLILGVIVIASAVIGWCPVYYLARAIRFPAKNID